MLRKTLHKSIQPPRRNGNYEAFLWDDTRQGLSFLYTAIQKVLLAALVATAASAATVIGTIPVLATSSSVTVTLSNRSYVYTAQVQPGTSFEFSAVTPGIYDVKIAVSGYSQKQSISVDVTTAEKATVSNMSLESSDSTDSSYKYTWVQDQSYVGLPLSEIQQNIVIPTSVKILGVAYTLANVNYSQELFTKYGIALVSDEEPWTLDYAYRLYSVLESIPQVVSTGYIYNSFLKPTKWSLSKTAIGGDISIQSTNSTVRVSSAAFTYAAPVVAEIEGVRGKYFSKRLHRALVAYVTDNGSNQAAVMKILQDRFGLKIDTPQTPLPYAQFTSEPSTRFQTWFKHPNELVEIINDFEELPEGFAKITGFNWLVRRVDGAVNPKSPEAPALAWESGFLEVMEKAFISFDSSYITRLFLHEKAHYVYQFLVSPTLKNAWIELGGWQGSGDSWFTTKTTEFVSAYAHDRNPNEDFAESVAAFVNNPDILKARSIAKYNFLRDQVMFSNSYVSIIRPDLTFVVLNLYPSYDYPGKIRRISTTVTGAPNDDKDVYVEIEIQPFRSGQTPVVDIVGRMFSSKSKEVPVAVFRDFVISPINSAGTIFGGHVKFSRYTRSGFWELPNITIRDNAGTARYESSILYGWKLYINNPQQDITPPAVRRGTSSLSIRRSTDPSKPGQIASLKFAVDENTGLASFGLAASLARPDSSYSIYQYGTPSTTEWQVVDFYLKDTDPSGKYFVSLINLRDLGDNSVYAFFRNPLGISDGTVQNIDEPAPFVDVTTVTPDLTPPQLDENRITITAIPTNPSAPDGETLVTIKYFVKDDISGYGEKSSMKLRDPQGLEHFYYLYHPNLYTSIFVGDPTAWQEYTQQIILPRGSPPGIWGLLQMTVCDKAGNCRGYSFLETVRFNPSGAATDLEITTQPRSRSVSLGNSVSLSVVARGGNTVLYEWFKDGLSLLKTSSKPSPQGGLVAGANSATLLIQNMSKELLGTYYAVLTASGGRLVSGIATLSLAGAPAIRAGGVVALNTTVSTIQPGAWFTIYGNDLAPQTAVWQGDFPTTLEGTSVKVNGKDAYLWFVSPTQINLQAPDQLNTTGMASVVVTTPAGTTTSSVSLAAASPSFNLLDDRHVAAIILRLDGKGAFGAGTYDVVGPTGSALGYPTVAAKTADTVVLYGVGFGTTTPVVPAGAPYSGAAPAKYLVTLTINGRNLTPTWAGMSGPGLFQFNLTIPPGLGVGDQPIQAVVNGVSTPSGVVLALQ